LFKLGFLALRERRRRRRRKRRRKGEKEEEEEEEEEWLLPANYCMRNLPCV
jgi:hypothetical protein